MDSQKISEEAAEAAQAINRALKDLSALDQHKAIQIAIMALRDARAQDAEGLSDLDNRLRKELAATPLISKKTD